MERTASIDYDTDGREKEKTRHIYRERRFISSGYVGARHLPLGYSIVDTMT